MLRKLFFAVCFCGIALAHAQDIKIDYQDLLDFQTISNRDFHTGKYDSLKPVLSKERVRREAESIEVDLEIDGKIHELSLVPSDRKVYSDDIPVWTVTHLSDKNCSYVYEPVSKNMKILDDDMYVDSEQMASLRVSRDPHNRKYFGVVGRGSRKQFARNIRGTLRRGKSRNINRMTINPTGRSLKPFNNAARVANTSLLAKPLDTFYVEVLPVVDYHLFKSLGYNIIKALKYVSAFWTEVDLMFSKLEMPKVRIIITGVIIAQDIYALEYIQESLEPGSSNSANILTLRNLACQYFYKHFVEDTGFRNYDIAIIMTSLDTGKLTGSADRGMVCNIVQNAGIVGDNAKFSGVHPATHEIGHFLNLPHDGSLDAKNCDGYAIHDAMSVMAPRQRTVSEYYWSNCSKDILRNFSKLRRSGCLAQRT